MSEEYILRYIPERIKQLGYLRYYIRYRDLTILPYSDLSLQGDLWFVVDDPPGLVIESDYGIYDSTGAYVEENTHEHKREIVITNPDGESKKIKFIEVIIIH